MNEDFKVDLPSLRVSYGLTHIEAKMLQLLMQEEIATHTQLLETNSRVRQLMYTLRSKLTKFDITIISDRDVGYSIPLPDKIKIRTTIEDKIRFASISLLPIRAAQ
jgi:hypothetical protein